MTFQPRAKTGGFGQGRCPGDEARRSDDGRLDRRGGDERTKMEQGRGRGRGRGTLGQEECGEDFRVE